LVLVACGGQGLQPGQLVVSGAVTAFYSMRSPTFFSSGSGCYGGPYGPGSLIEVPEAAIEMQIFGVNPLDKSRTVYTDANTARWTYLRCYAQSVPGLSNVSAICSYVLQIVVNPTAIAWNGDYSTDRKQLAGGPLAGASRAVGRARRFPPRARPS
jgi:hypothetical protein